LAVVDKDSRKKHNNKHKSHEPNTAGEFFKGVGFTSGRMGQKCTKKQCKKWVCMQAFSSKMGQT